MTDTTKEPQIWKWMLILSAIVIGLWLGYPLVISYCIPDLGERGQFGDMFGSVNALFAGLAFAGVIWAIILQKNELSLQREELKLQRDELEQTRKEIKGQKEQLQAQDQTLKKQNFENSFFQLLRFHVDIVGSMETPGSGHSITGRSCFDSFIAYLANSYNAEPGDDFNETWRQFAVNNRRSVDHYFLHLYNTIKFVDQHPSIQNFKEKKHYTNLIRGQLASNELGILFYYCLSDRGGRLKRLVEKYSLLEGLSVNELLHPNHKAKFGDIAYGTAYD